MERSEEIFNILNKIDRIMQSKGITFGGVISTLERDYLVDFKYATNAEVAKELNRYISENGLQETKQYS